MHMFDTATFVIGARMPCLCPRGKVKDIGYWEKEHCFLLLCECGRIHAISIMGFLQCIFKRREE